MSALSFSDYQHQRARHLLEVLNDAIFVLKLDAQGKLTENGYTPEDTAQQQQTLVQFLERLSSTIQFLREEEESAHADYLLLAHRFIEHNPTTARSRIQSLERIRDRLTVHETLGERDFEQLDILHRLLEARVIQGYKGLFRF